MTTFWKETMLLLTLKRQDFVQFFEKLIDMVCIRFRMKISNRNRKKSLWFYNTAKKNTVHV
jgi:hypothetical protein